MRLLRNEKNTILVLRFLQGSSIQYITPPFLSNKSCSADNFVHLSAIFCLLSSLQQTHKPVLGRT